MNQKREIDATISILLQLQQWVQVVDAIESALERNRLDSVRQLLLMANNLLSNLEKQTRMISILPKMLARRDLLGASINDAFVAQWDGMITIDANKEGTTLAITDDTNGKSPNHVANQKKGLTAIVTNLQELDILESGVSRLSESLIERFIRPLLKENYTITASPAFLIKQESVSRSPDTTFKYLALLVMHLSTALPQTVLNILIPTLCPVLINNILTFLPAHVPTLVMDLPKFDTLLDAVTHFDTLLVNLGWISSTPLSKWVSDAPRIWFANRQATFLLETRLLVLREWKNQKNVVISSGINILSEPKAISFKIVEDQSQNETYADNTTAKAGDEEEETDGWGFDAEDDETGENTDLIGDTQPDAWNWDDENEDVKPVVSDPNLFPYSVSTIPDKLMEIIERLLSEGSRLQSPRFAFLPSMSNRSYSSHPTLRYATDYPIMVASIFATWRAIVQLRRTDVTYGQRMKLSNDALYLSHCLIPHSIDPNISAELQRLSQCGSTWFNQELVLQTLRSWTRPSNGRTLSRHRFLRF
jgi:hypothetical protein